MILTSYYKFEKIPSDGTKTRIDCTASTANYQPIEKKRNKKGELFVYIGDNTHTEAGVTRKADIAITKDGHITSIYVPNRSVNIWFGDMKNTEDALLFVVSDVRFINGGIQPKAIIEMFVANGGRCDRNQLYNAFCDGELREEAEALRKQAIDEKMNPIKQRMCMIQ